MPDGTRNNVATRHPAMASKLVTERGFRRERLSSSATNPHHHLREGPLGFDWFRPHLVDVRGIVDRPPPKRSAGALRGDPKSPGNKTSVISGREAPRPRNTTPSPYRAPCRAGSRDGQFGGNALGRACSLTCRNSRRNHTAGTSEAPATSLQAPRISHKPRTRDRCPIEQGTHGNTVWGGTARSTSAARIR
jgi:hypothetical protein